jgi:hypothetical protein
MSKASLILVVLTVFACLVIGCGKKEPIPAAPLTTDVCSVASHPELFESRTLIIKSEIYLGMHGSGLGSDPCRYQWIHVDFSDEFQHTPEFALLMRSRFRRIPGTFTGTFRPTEHGFWHSRGWELVITHAELQPPIDEAKPAQSNP